MRNNLLESLSKRELKALEESLKNYEKLNSGQADELMVLAQSQLQSIKLRDRM